jgi:CelD/BcsL family acetyltransferase involved in cellulose biosynthesis
MKRRYARSPTIEFLNEAQDFADLREDWENLYQSSVRATPFQTWGWLYSWWESYGGAYELRLITMRDGNLLVGAIPLMLERSLGSPGRLLFIGTGLTDYLDILARKGFEAQVAEAGTKALMRLGSWKLLTLDDLAPEAAAWSLCRRWPGPRTYVCQKAWQGWQLGCPVIEVKPWDELLTSVSTRLRKNARRSLRRAADDNVRGVPAGPHEAERAAQRLVALHRKMLQERGLNPEHSSDRFETHLVAAAKRMTTSRSGAIYEFWRGGEVLASHFLLFGHDFVGDYMVGAKLEALQRYQMHSLYTWNAVHIARCRGNNRISLLRGEEPYKLRWASEVVYNYQAVLSRKPISKSRNRRGVHPTLPLRPYVNMLRRF